MQMCLDSTPISLLDLKIEIVLLELVLSSNLLIPTECGWKCHGSSITADDIPTQCRLSPEGFSGGRGEIEGEEGAKRTQIELFSQHQGADHITHLPLWWAPGRVMWRRATCKRHRGRRQGATWLGVRKIPRDKEAKLGGIWRRDEKEICRNTEETGQQIALYL